MKKIAVLIDFTQTCYKSVEFAQKVYEKSGAEIVLLHVSDDPEKEEEIVEQVKSYANLLEENNTPYTTLIDYGKFFSTVEMAVAKSGADMVIVGTHGKSGLKQNLFGSTCRVFRHHKRVVRQPSSRALIEGWGRFNIMVMGVLFVIGPSITWLML